MTPGTGPARGGDAGTAEPDVRIRRATLADAEAIRSIYNLEVTTSTVTFDLVPRTLAEQREWLRARSGAHAVLVAVSGPTAVTGGPGTGEVVGFGSLSPYRDRPAYATTVEDSVYVRRDRRGTGVGRALLAALVETATAHGFHTVIGRIVGGHAASLTLHRAVGFELVGVEREVGRKFGRWLDVVVVQRMLGGSTSREAVGEADEGESDVLRR